MGARESLILTKALEDSYDRQVGETWLQTFISFLALPLSSSSTLSLPA